MLIDVTLSPRHGVYLCMAYDVKEPTHIDLADPDNSNPMIEVQPDRAAALVWADNIVPGHAHQEWAQPPVTYADGTMIGVIN